MSSFGKPASLPRWATTGTIVEPSSGQKDSGWTLNQIPPSSFENWITNLTYLWLAWVDERVFEGAGQDDVEITGFNVVSGTDQDGGDMTVSGGSSTGDGGSEINFQLAEAGQGAGAAVRTPANVGRFRENGAFNLEPRAADAASPIQGDLEVLDSGKLKLHNGTDWEPVVSQSFAMVAAASLIASTAAETVFDQNYTIPANSLRVGSAIRIRAWCEVDNVTATPSLVFRIRVGGLGGTILAQVSLNPTGAGFNTFLEATVVLFSTGGTGDMSYFGLAVTDLGTPNIVSTPTGVNTIDTTATQQVVLTADWSAASASNAARMNGMIIDVLG